MVVLTDATKVARTAGSTAVCLEAESELLMAALTVEMSAVERDAQRAEMSAVYSAASMEHVMVGLSVEM